MSQQTETSNAQHTAPKRLASGRTGSKKTGKQKKAPAHAAPGKRAAGGGKRPGPERTKKQILLRRLYIALTVLAAVVVGVFLWWHFFTAPPEVPVDPDQTLRPETTMVVDEEGNEVEVEIPGVAANRKGEFYTFLLVGQDTFGGGNTDTMMLVAYNVKDQALNVMSLPRDTFVNYNGRKVLLNSVYNRAGGTKNDKGIKALKKEVGELTGVTPDFHVIVQWAAVGELVDAIDGVDFDVPRRMYYNDLSQNFKIDLQKGYQHLDGAKAMQLIRWRHNSDDKGNILNSGYANGDIGRIQTQQDFMKAIIKKCLQPSVLLPNLAEYITIFQNNVVTDLTTGQLAYFGKSAVGGLDMENVNFSTMPWKNAGDGAHVLPIGSQLVETINAGFNPYQRDIRLSELDLVTSVTTTSTSASPAVSEAVRETPAESTTPDPESSQEVSGGEVVQPPEAPVTTPAASSPPAESEAVTSPEPATTAEPTPTATSEPAAPEQTPPPAEATPVPEQTGQATESTTGGDAGDEPLLPPGA